MLRRAQPNHLKVFELIDFMVVVESRAGRGMLSEASVKMKVDDEISHTVAEGDGPVHALDLAMRKALLPHYPKLRKMRLTDYKVRIIDSDHATGATTRVTIDSTDGRRSWTTVGCSSNIVDASWQALADSFEYALVVA